jgi:hypothetical protein
MANEKKYNVSQDLPKKIADEKLNITNNPILATDQLAYAKIGFAADNLQEVVGPYIDIPHPTPLQIAQDVYSNLRVLSTNKIPYTVDKKEQYKINPIKTSELPDSKVATSALGTSVMQQLIITVFTDNVLYTESKNVEIVGQYANFKYNDVLISVSQSKKIVVTNIAGNDGSIKEFIGLGDFEINITGRLTGNYGQSPRTDFINLTNLLKSNRNLAVACPYLTDLGISEIIVTSFDLPQNVGEFSTQYFTINAISDFSPELSFINFITPSTQ